MYSTTRLPTFWKSEGTYRDGLLTSTMKTDIGDEIIETNLLISHKADNRLAPEAINVVLSLSSSFYHKLTTISNKNEGANANFVVDHKIRLSFLFYKVGNYLHYQDNWVETFRIALYEACKLYSLAIYKPELYCEMMLLELNVENQKKVIIAKNPSQFTEAFRPSGRINRSVSDTKIQSEWTFSITLKRT